MKKVILMLMLVIGRIANADWEVVISGNDRETDTNNSYPSITVLYDSNDGKYDIYRFTQDHGYWIDKGTVFTKEGLNQEVKYKYLKIFTYKGKKCINLTKEQVIEILNAIQFKESAGY